MAIDGKLTDCLSRLTGLPDRKPAKCRLQQPIGHFFRRLEGFTWPYFALQVTFASAGPKQWVAHPAAAADTASRLQIANQNTASRGLLNSIAASVIYGEPRSAKPVKPRHRCGRYGHARVPQAPTLLS